MLAASQSLDLLITRPRNYCRLRSQDQTPFDSTAVFIKSIKYHDEVHSLYIRSLCSCWHSGQPLLELIGRRNNLNVYRRDTIILGRASCSSTSH
ncbi:hypothetical protein PILCRDRAFT_820235 [Piloderma croceum F 1598]|uniref:Uncharacterized protein n=1 Tax=Piloderma croceum (strain F 1598) TaxID=765440 RepID=A0A0C3FU32_PILCF|nr:hypothetical protein PILCRDRAFT_820235 [Piloderma croceum F 1598]